MPKQNLFWLFHFDPSGLFSCRSIRRACDQSCVRPTSIKLTPISKTSIIYWIDCVIYNQSPNKGKHVKRRSRSLFIYLFTIKVRVIHTSLNFVHTLKTYLKSHASKNINMVSQRLYILINECNKATAMLQRLTILYMSAIKQRACCRGFT